MDKVIFVAPRNKELVLVHTPMGLKDAQGNKIKAVHICFTFSKIGAKYETSDPKIIDWLKKHEYFSTKKIEIFSDDNSYEDNTPQVSKGMIAARIDPEQVKAQDVVGAEGSDNIDPQAKKAGRPKKGK